jgi:hypothetical protein
VSAVAPLVELPPAAEPHAVPPPAAAPRRAWVLVALIGVVALPRLAVFPFAENFRYGDAISRSELAEQWASDPHIIRGFGDGARQFGPLHFYAMGLVLKVWPDRENATRLISLLFGILAVIPLFRIARRFFGLRPAVLASLAFAVWPLHIQASTTAGSEALFLCLFLGSLDALIAGLDRGRFRWLVIAALLLGLACATRYDGWLYIPIFGGTIAVWGRDRVAAVTRAIIFLIISCVFPLWWMQLNELSMGDPLYPIHFIEDFHRQWARSEAAWLSQVGFRAYALGFWPGAVVVTLSPLVGLFCLAGVVRSLREHRNRALAILALLPVGYYAVRGAVFMSFAPISRFFMPEIALVMPYLSTGFDYLFGKSGPSSRRLAAIGAGALAVVFPLWMGWTTAWSETHLANDLRPISPISTIPVDQMEVARWVKAHAGPDDVVLVDQDATYDDLNLAYYSGRPESYLIRRRWEDFEKKLRARLPTYVITMENGDLSKTEGIRFIDGKLDLRGTTYVPVYERGSRFRVFKGYPPARFPTGG